MRNGPHGQARTVGEVAQRIVSPRVAHCDGRRHLRAPHGDPIGAVEVRRCRPVPLVILAAHRAPLQRPAGTVAHIEFRLRLGGTRPVRRRDRHGRQATVGVREPQPHRAVGVHGHLCPVRDRSTRSRSGRSFWPARPVRGARPRRACSGDGCRLPRRGRWRMASPVFGRRKALVWASQSSAHALSSGCSWRFW